MTAIVVVIAVAINGCEGVSSPTQEPTDSSPTPENLTATELWEESESNPVRFEKTYIGEKVRITGAIWEISHEQVDLVVEEDVYKRSGFILVKVRLRGFAEAEILQMDKGKEVTADCTVGDHDFWLQLNDCMLIPS